MAKTKPFDPAEYLGDEEVRVEYLKEAFKTRDSEYIARAIGTVAKARGMTAVAEKTGLSRESLYRSLGTKPNPEFGTVVKVLDSLGMQLSVGPRSSKGSGAFKKIAGGLKEAVHIARGEAKLAKLHKPKGKKSAS